METGQPARKGRPINSLQGGVVLMFASVFFCVCRSVGVCVCVCVCDTLFMGMTAGVMYMKL